MHESTTLERSVSAPADVWRDDNSRGLSFAATGNWSDASHAFTTAADALSARNDVAAHDALALILNNLAQSCFHDGRTDDAIRYAQRACALRVALVGEDAIAVARARSELAVMLGSANRATEGLSLIARAISAIERDGGDEDIRLLTVLENAARLALAAGQPSTAEPYLLRLHALLDAHGMSTDAVESLLARVVSFRFEQQILAMESLVDTSSDVEADEPNEVNTETPVELPMLVIDAFGDADDEPLRDAVAITDVLLRTTPTGNRAIVADADPTPTGDIFGGALFELVDLQESPVAVSAVVEPDVVPETPAMASASMLVELDLLGGDDSSASLELVPVQHTDESPVNVSDGGLGFTVEYGAVSSAMPHEDMVEPTVIERPSPVADAVVDAGVVAPIVVDVVAPPAPEIAASAQPTLPRLTLHDTDDVVISRQLKKPVLRAGRANAPQSSNGMFIAGGAVAAAIAAAGWFLMMGK